MRRPAHGIRRWQAKGIAKIRFCEGSRGGFVRLPGLCGTAMSRRRGWCRRSAVAALCNADPARWLKRSRRARDNDGSEGGGAGAPCSGGGCGRGLRAVQQATSHWRGVRPGCLHTFELRMREDAVCTSRAGGVLAGKETCSSDAGRRAARNEPRSGSDPGGRNQAAVAERCRRRGEMGSDARECVRWPPPPPTMRRRGGGGGWV